MKFMKLSFFSHILLDKSVYFPKQRILAITDLHLGYETMLRERGLIFPLNQLEESKKDIRNIIKFLERKKLEVKKIIILGDLKHQFGFSSGEAYEVRGFLRYLENFVSPENIILIKGNHEKIELDKDRYRDFYIEDEVAFLHGDKIFPEVLGKKIKTLVMGHSHPSITISDKGGIKKEKYKCFLIGKWKGKEIIVLPSFFSFNEGSKIAEGFNKDFFIIPRRTLNNFKVHVVGKDKVYEFGKLREI